jgi:hypothetical protein
MLDIKIYHCKTISFFKYLPLQNSNSQNYALFFIWILLHNAVSKQTISMNNKLARTWKEAWNCMLVFIIREIISEWNVHLTSHPQSWRPRSMHYVQHGPCFGMHPSTILSTCSSQSCLHLLIPSFIENTPNSFYSVLGIAFLLFAISACKYILYQREAVVGLVCINTGHKLLFPASYH